MQTNIIPEDWERESQKDSIYLQEEMKLIEQEILREESERKDAIIEVIPQDKKKKDDSKSETLPF